MKNYKISESHVRDDHFRTLLKDKIKSLNNTISYYHRISREEDYVQYYQVQIEDNGFVAGLSARLYWDCMEVDDFFIEQEFRFQGLGSYLLEMAIEEAIKQNKSFVFLSTFSFQARNFYEKFGFYVIGEIKDYPPGESLYTLRLDIKKNETLL